MSSSVSSFRVTQRSVSSTMLRGLQANLAGLQRIQEQLSSGRQVNRPSDSPVKTVEAMQFRGELRRAEQHLRNTDDGLALLGTADRALVSTLEMTRRARDLTVQGLNGSINAAGREALAAEIDSLREGLLGLANTRYLDRPIFGGTTAGTAAYSVPGGTYEGDDGVLRRTVAPGTQVEVTVSGPEVFGHGEDSLFGVLTSVSAALRSGDDAAVSRGLGRLDVATDRIVTTLGTLGARTNRLETMRDRAFDQRITLSNSLAEVESIDLPKTIVDLQMQEVAYQAALGATARVVQPSLLDFLR